MILYDNHEHLRSLLQVEGSVVYRTIPSGLVMAVIAEAIALWLWRSEQVNIWRPFVEDPWAANSVSFAITFAIVFRCGIAWNRYWEAARETQSMYSKWADCFAQLIASINSTDSKFEADMSTAEEPGVAEQLLQKREAMAHIRLSLAHSFSVLSAMASHRLTHGDIAVMTRHAAKFGTQSTFLCSCCKLRKEWHNLVVSRQDLRFRDRGKAAKMPNLFVYALQDLGAEIRSRSRKKTKARTLRKAGTMFQNDMKAGMQTGTLVTQATTNMITDVARVGDQFTNDVLNAGTAATTATVGAAKVGAAKVGAGLSAGAMAGAASASAVMEVMKAGRTGTKDMSRICSSTSIAELTRAGPSTVSFGGEECASLDEESDLEESDLSEQSEEKADRPSDLSEDVHYPSEVPQSQRTIKTSLRTIGTSSEGRRRSHKSRGHTSTNSAESNMTWNADLGILNAMTDEELEALMPEFAEASTPPDRVNMVSEWIREDINSLVSIVMIPPPIMSRCYQLLSSGVLGFNQSLKIADIPFPLPFSQLLEYLLLMFSFVLPLYTAVFTGGLLLTPILAFCVTVSLWSLTEISRELENPFEDGPNQLPIVDAHERFVELVRSVYHTRKPKKAKVKREVSNKSQRSTATLERKESGTDRGSATTLVTDDIAVVCTRASSELEPDSHVPSERAATEKEL